MSSSDNDSSVDMAKFLLYRKLMSRWDKTLTVGGFLFITTLAVFLFLSFVKIVQMTEALQIFIIGVIMFMLVFRYFKELTVGTISGKTSLPVAPAQASITGPPPPPMRAINVRITSPKNGATFSGNLDWVATVDVEEELKVLTFYLDSEVVGNLSGRSPYKMTLEAVNLEKGEHNLQVAAFRTDMAKFESEIVKITKI